MALNIPMPESPGKSLLQGLDTGSSMMSRIMQPVIERERMKQQQAQFAQDYILKKQAESRANALMPYMIQQYQDTHKTSANAAQMKELYLGLMQDALHQGGGGGSPPATMGGGMEPQPGGMAPPKFRHKNLMRVKGERCLKWGGRLLERRVYPHQVCLMRRRHLYHP